MHELKQDLKQHMLNDREDFQAIRDEFKAVNEKLDLIRGQWKIVGAFVGAFVGLLGTIVASWI